ncbi:MAG TPA: glycosyltransferase family 4 protein [Candidatus Krumholzibacteria bacterium]|nr:glycosyltransferase family 4 protein [Candidatus Krumholzibacteria bacterium]
MRVLVFTNMYPTPAAPFYGPFVHDEVEALRKAGVETDLYFVNGRASKANYFAMPFGFFKRMRARQYDIVHVHHSFCGLIATMQHSVPVVWTFHEGEISGNTRDALREHPIRRIAYSRRLKRHVARRVDAIIVVAEHLRAQLGRPDAVWLPAGVDMDTFVPMDSAEARRKLGLADGKRYVLFPSSPSRVEKRYELAKAAVDRLRASSPAMSDVELLTLDNVPHSTVPHYINASELMLMTSSFEASPVTIRESLACNVPVLCTDVGDARVVLEGVPGCAIIEPDPARIAQALATALAGPRRVEARARMEAYSLRRGTAQLLEIYGRLTGAGGSR